MDFWIDLARGPLFHISLTVMVLGICYRLAVVLTQVAVAWRGAGDRKVPYRDVAAATLGWLVPVRLLRSRPLYSAASFLFHVGILALLLFLAPHVAMLSLVLPAAWPTLPAAWADVLTVMSIVTVAVLLAGRLVVAAARRLTRAQDALVLLALLMTVLSGFMSAHPAAAPVAARTMLLLHLLCGNLVLILVPLSKIAHCVLYPFTQLVFQLGWHFPAATGQHVAVALSKENEPV